MYIITLKKRQTLNNKGSMTIDANFVKEEVLNKKKEIITEGEAFNKSFVFPIDATESDVKKEIKTWIEEKEEEEKIIFDPKTPVDLSGVVTDRVAFKEYTAKKKELTEVAELVALGAMSADDPMVTSLQADVKTKYKPEYVKMKK